LSARANVHDLLPTETISIHLPHARRAAVRVAKRDGVSVVWTTSYPYSAHLVGAHVKQALGVPFVADLRDPWTLNFVHEQKLAPARAAERALERYVFAHADRIVVTTESLADAYRAVYPAIADRFVTIRNGFEPVELPPRRVGDGPKRLVHFGHVYSQRTLAPVLRSLARIDAHDIVLDNLGRLSDADRALTHSLGLDAIVNAREPLPYLEGLASLRTADALLLPAWGTDRGALLLPGKLYDYLLAGAPIVAIGRNAELARILAHTRTGVLVDPDDASGLDRALRDALAGTLPFDPDPVAIWSYSAPEATRRLARLFDEIARRPDVG
jgi:glycosyltransferase involved in cell wall biosynthesis